MSNNPPEVLVGFTNEEAAWVFVMSTKMLGDSLQAMMHQKDTLSKDELRKLVDSQTLLKGINAAIEQGFEKE